MLVISIIILFYLLHMKLFYQVEWYYNTTVGILRCIAASLANILIILSFIAYPNLYSKIKYNLYMQYHSRFELNFCRVMMFSLFVIHSGILYYLINYERFSFALLMIKCFIGEVAILILAVTCFFLYKMF
jgi:hypothetical protein